MTPHKILIEMPMTEIPEKDGLYLVDSPGGKFEAYWNERFSFHEEFIDGAIWLMEEVRKRGNLR